MAAKLKEDMFQQFLTSLVFFATTELWNWRDSIIFDNKAVSTDCCIANVRRKMMSIAFMLRRTIKNSVQEMMILRAFNISPRYNSATILIEVYKVKPLPG